MKAKLFAIALIAAVCYATIASVRAYGDEPQVLTSVRDDCIDLKSKLIIVYDKLDILESAGAHIPDDIAMKVVAGSVMYTTHCEPFTGPLFPEEE